MSEAVNLAIVSALVTVLVALIGNITIWLKARDALRMGQNNNEDIKAVHTIVNSQKTAMLERIDRLEELLKQEKKEKEEIINEKK